MLEDTQGSRDVTDKLVDLDARLRSARATERRLTDLLANRTAKLSDVLEVERELARVRIEIERLDAEHTTSAVGVTYAALTLEIMEERKAGLTPGPLSFAKPVTRRRGGRRRGSGGERRLDAADGHGSRPCPPALDARHRLCMAGPASPVAFSIPSP